MVGKRIIHYEIVNRLGAGGMGEVYRAQDTRLGRSVALKILPEMFASDEERVARFEREARLLASLNHPNIAVLYGLERAEGKSFLVMELVQGETLAERVMQGPVPIEEALRIAHQMAQGLETAHAEGIVHRDLKPANIMVTPDGKVKILDFGLAKALLGTGPQADVLSSPTLTAAATNAGIILGTAAYMSPEQAKGQDTDARTDVFAFGCILFEILVGRRTFPGDTVTEAIASVLAREPDFSALPARTHPKIPDMLRRCLNKDPKQRWQAIGDVRVEIESVLADPRGVSGFIAGEKKPLWKRALSLTLASFSNLEVPQFDFYVAHAGIEHTWIDIDPLRVNLLKNQHAQHWYRLFLRADTEDAAWGALQMMLQCADRRFFIWRAEYEIGAPRKRLRFLKGIDDEVSKSLKREKQRDETLFGIKIERGEVFPFVHF